MWASSSGGLDSVRTLLEFGAAVNARTNVRNQVMIIIVLAFTMFMMMMTVIIVIISC